MTVYNKNRKTSAFLLKKSFVCVTILLKLISYLTLLASVTALTLASLFLMRFTVDE